MFAHKISYMKLYKIYMCLIILLYIYIDVYIYICSTDVTYTFIFPPVNACKCIGKEVLHDTA